MYGKILIVLVYLGATFVLVSPSTSSSIFFSKPYDSSLIQAPTSDYTFISTEISTSHLNNTRYKRSLSAPYESSIKQECDGFSNNEEGTNVIYSPGYPKDYPNNTNCTVLITAPSGHLIRLDFRNYFNIEESDDCKFDSLEVRDGGYGYSKLLGKFCGNVFPPMLTTTDRYMWLHFTSDENIEYKGFTAVFEFIPRPTQSIPETQICQINVTGNEGFMNRSHIDEKYVEIAKAQQQPLDCMWLLHVKENWNIQLSFPEFELAKPNECEKNFIDIFSDKTILPSRLKRFCGSIADSISSKTNIVHVRFYALPSGLTSKFSILYTAYREKVNGKNCHDDEYDCEDATCISKDLRCNGRVNCRFRWDEDECNKPESGHSEHVVIIVVVFGLILGGMMTAFLVNCIRKLVRDHKIIREHIRQSKESKLDELGRHSTKISRENIAIKIHPGKKDMPIPGILDEIPHRYFRENMSMPILTGNTRIEMKRENNSRNRDIKDILETTHISDEDDELRSGMCDMACQTRESLFQTNPKTNNNNNNKSVQQPTTNPPRFSTFGYDAETHTPSSAGQVTVDTEKSIKPTTKSKKTVATTIEMEGIGVNVQNENFPIKQLQHSTQPQSDQNIGKNQFPFKKPIKTEESRLVLDIRNSAPDVIIMTSSH